MTELLSWVGLQLFSIDPKECKQVGWKIRVRIFVFLAAVPRGAGASSPPFDSQDV